MLISPRSGFFFPSNSVRDCQQRERDLGSSVVSNHTKGVGPCTQTRCTLRGQRESGNFDIKQSVDRHNNYVE